MSDRPVSESAPDVHEVRGRVTALERSMEEMASTVTSLGRETRQGFDRITTLIDQTSKQTTADIRTIERNSAEANKPNWAAWGVIVTVLIVVGGYYTTTTTKPAEEAIKAEAQHRREADDAAVAVRTQLIEQNSLLRERVTRLETVRELWQEGKLK